MTTAKIFKNGGSQAVRLPKEFQFDEDEVCIKRVSPHAIMIFPKSKAWELFREGLQEFTDDFMAERDQGKLEDIEPL